MGVDDVFHVIGIRIGIRISTDLSVMWSIAFSIVAFTAEVIAVEAQSRGQCSIQK